MALLNYSTKIDVSKTIGEITKALVELRANKIVSDYEDGIPVCITFTLLVNKVSIGFSLPCNWQGVLRRMEKDTDIRKGLCTKEQAIRVSWRIIKDWIEAQGAIIQSGLVDAEEVFLPYTITKSGNTLYSEMKQTGFLELGTGS